MQNTTKIVLIMPPSNCVDNDRLEAPLGLLYIASVIRENNYDDVSIFDMSGCKNEQEITNIINSIPSADVYGLTVFCSNHIYAKRCIEKIRNINPQSFIIAGGPNPSAMPELTLKDLNPDVVITGEGEDAFMTVVDRLKSSSQLSKIVIGIGRENIDSYPIPARDLIDTSTYTKMLMDKLTISMITSRGCKNNCLHCNSNVMGGGNPTPRYRSTKNILKEINQLRKDSFKYIRFSDDNFTANPNIGSLLERLAEYDIQFRIFARIEHLDGDTCRLLKEAGCVHVSVGLESLNPDNLRVLGKASQIEKEGNIQIAKDYGLVIRASFMVGLPYDTQQTVERYFNMAEKLPFDEFEILPLIPFPGTRIAKFAERFGYEIINDDFASYVLIGKNRRTTYALKHKNFSPEDVMKWRMMAENILKLKGKCYMKDSKIAQ